jgi:hypothetical protein
VTVNGADDKKLDQMEQSQQFRNINVRKQFLHNEKSILEFKGLAGKALNPEPYCMPILESLSCGSGIPTAILRGAQAGALTGSEVNEREYFGYISGKQTLGEPAIWELIDRLMETGQIRKVEDYKVVWLNGIELGEKDKAAVELQQAQARNFKTGWLTVDEVRAEEKLKPLPNGAGAVVLGVKKTEVQPFQQSGGQSPEPVSQGDVGPFTWVLSRLRRKKQDANDKTG